jgi:hypothetical protein
MNTDIQKKEENFSQEKIDELHDKPKNAEEDRLVKFLTLRRKMLDNQY